VKTYYNEWEPYSAAWLRNLIEAGLLPAGDVDERDIREIKGSDLDGYGQCHFFAGIGGWPLALALAGWPADAPVWSGSCPCQPFSVAGSRMGEEDERHLWPDFARLIGECRPTVVFGEQVASAYGRTWLSRVRADLEELGYGVGAADLCAAGIGAPHIRQRLWWVGNAYSEGPQGRGGRPEQGAGERSPWTPSITIPCLDGKARRIEPGIMPLAHGVSGRVGQIRAYGNAIVPQVAAEFVKAYMDISSGGVSGVRGPS
jgi:DNA (cytosine-5)-methyltransferase 1